MFNTYNLIVAAGVLALSIAVGAPNSSAEDFYNGKTLTIMVGYRAGGGNPGKAGRDLRTPTRRTRR